MLSFLLFISCGIRNKEIEKETINQEHFILYRLWQQGDIQGFEQFLDKKKGDDQNQSFWAIANRLYTEKGRKTLNAEELERGKYYGLQCLLEEDNFSSLVSLRKGQITKQAIEVLEDTDELIVQCMLWTTISWSLWLHQRGGQILLSDVKTVQMMADWVFSVREDKWTHYAMGITQALVDIEQTPNWMSMQEHFQKAQEIDSLVDFELYYYHHRFVEKELYCQKKREDWRLIAPTYQSLWEESRFVCQE